MGVPTFDHDMKIIQKLPDEPNDVGGLSPAELKAKFDEGGEALKAYINQVLLPELEKFGVAAVVLLGEDAGFSYLRRNADKVLETSADGKNWEATGSFGGHLIYDKDGKEVPQRTRIRFFGTLSDDGVHTGVRFTAQDVGAAELEHLQDIAHGGTGANNAETARRNLGIPNITSGVDEPSGGEDGDFYFQYAE